MVSVFIATNAPISVLDTANVIEIYKEEYKVRYRFDQLNNWPFAEQKVETIYKIWEKRNKLDLVVNCYR